MDRRQILKWLGALSAFILPGQATQFAIAAEGGTVRLVKTKTEWAALLPRDAYRVLFQEDTEAPGTSALNNERRDGSFICAALGRETQSRVARARAGKPAAAK